jgi:hypothetical protein
VTRSEVLAWLDARRPVPPATLRERIHRAVASTTPHSPFPVYLAELGRGLLERVAARPQGGRELALDLLAADAFVTYAFEAQAEEAVGGIASLAAGVGR